MLMNNKPRYSLLIWLGGMVAGNVTLAVTYALAVAAMTGLLSLIDRAQTGEVFLFVVGLPSFAFVPLFAGAVASLCWRSLRPGVGMTALGTLGMAMIALVGAAVFLQEGVICLLIVAPLFYAVVFGGALIGRVAFRKDVTKLRLSVLPFLALLAFGEPLFRMDQTDVVVDEVVIKAPPAKVWPNVTRFPAIQTPPDYWMFKMGLPYPMETTSGGDFVGADRECIFTDGMVFGEKVSEWVKNENLTFDITELPQHPELIGHITPYRGQFLLKDNGDGTTTLIGSTWYVLHVRPLWYFNWWTEQIFRAVHLRVMHDIRERSEAL